MPIVLDPLERETIYIWSLSNEVGLIDIDPIDAVPIAINPLAQEPTLLRRYTRSFACLKPIFNNSCAITNLLYLGVTIMSLPIIDIEPINVEPMDAVPIALDPREREPIDI